MSSPVTIQPSIADGCIGESSQDAVYSTEPVNYINGSTDHRLRSLVSIDFSASVPAGSTIATATLSLYFVSPVAAHTLTVYRFLRPTWVEAQATWNIYKTGSSWGTPGALNTTTDITTTDLATAASASGNGWVSWNVKNQVQTALDSVSGVAHFLLADVDSAANAEQSFVSRRYTGNTSLCPKLYIEYTVPSLTGAAFLLRMV